LEGNPFSRPPEQAEEELFSKAKKLADDLKKSPVIYRA